MNKIRDRTNTISHWSYKYIYLREKEILHALDERDVIKFNNKVPMNIIDDVRGNDISSISMKYASKFYQFQIDEISNLLYKSSKT